MSNYNKVKTEGVEENAKIIRARFSKWEADFIISILSTFAEKVHKATLEDMYEKLDKNYLKYCREHNGLPYCKNCGLDLEELRNLMK